MGRWPQSLGRGQLSRKWKRRNLLCCNVQCREPRTLMFSGLKKVTRSQPSKVADTQLKRRNPKSEMGRLLSNSRSKTQKSLIKEAINWARSETGETQSQTVTLQEEQVKMEAAEGAADV